MHTEIFDSGARTIVDCAHVKVERLSTVPVLFSKVFKEVEDPQGQRYDYRYWAERENFFLREFLKKKNEFTRVVQPRHLISENEAAKQVLTCDAGITIANWLRVRPRYADGSVLSHPFQRADAFLQMMRACLTALKQIHRHRIVHCDIKEDNICVPYTPYPYVNGGQNICIDFAELKLIDFAFSISHAMPLTQILIINPDDQAPYQSPKLIAALKEDRSSGAPNAVQQLDHCVDFFSLGYMVGKILDGGLVCPRGADSDAIVDGAQAIVRNLKESDATAGDTPEPHDELLSQVDRLIQLCAGHTAPAEFAVAGEWSAEEIRKGSHGPRKTPLTPVAPPVPTPVAMPLSSIPRTPARRQMPRLVPSRLALGIALGAILSLGVAVAGNFEFLHSLSVLTGSVLGSQAPSPAPVPDKVALAITRLGKQLRTDDDKSFQNGTGELAKLAASGKPAAKSLATAVASENGDTLDSQAARAVRERAWNRLKWMSAAGIGAASARVTAFEKSYDDAKQKITASPWWTQGAGAPPDEAARWMENGAILAAGGDRPAMLDQAFAEGHGRIVEQNRAHAVEAYLKIIARAEASDEVSGRIRLAAGHGLAAMLNAVVEQKDEGAAKSLQPVLEAKASAGAADMQYYLGLIDECVVQPADVTAAKRWYQRAETDPNWKQIAERKLAVAGSWCPGGAN